MSLGRPIVTVTLYGDIAEWLLAHCAAIGDQPSLVVKDELESLRDAQGPCISEDDAAALIGNGIAVGEQFEADLAAVAGEMGRPG